MCPRQSKKSSVVDITTYIYEEPMEPQVGGPGGTAVFILPSKTLDCTVRSAAITFSFFSLHGKAKLQCKQEKDHHN